MGTVAPNKKIKTLIFQLSVKILNFQWVGGACSTYGGE